jgi:hypothetical protein
VAASYDCNAPRLVAAFAAIYLMQVVDFSLEIALQRLCLRFITPKKFFTENVELGKFLALKLAHSHVEVRNLPNENTCIHC